VKHDKTKVLAKIYRNENSVDLHNQCIARERDLVIRMSDYVDASGKCCKNSSPSLAGWKDEGREGALLEETRPFFLGRGV